MKDRLGQELNIGDTVVFCADGLRYGLSLGYISDITERKCHIIEIRGKPNLFTWKSHQVLKVEGPHVVTHLLKI